MGKERERRTVQPAAQSEGAPGLGFDEGLGLPFDESDRSRYYISRDIGDRKTIHTWGTYSEPVSVKFTAMELNTPDINFLRWLQARETLAPAPLCSAPISTW